jgi:hypothetical protein
MQWPRRKKQPPIDRETRSPEHRMLWLGLLVGVIGSLLIVAGFSLPTGVATRAGTPASEQQLVSAFRHGGVSATPAPATGPASHPGVVDPNVEQACPT